MRACRTVSPAPIRIILRFLEGATQTQITTLTVNTSTDANGNFTVFGVATLQAIGFDQAALQNYLLTLAQAQEASSTFKTINLSYSDVTANFTTGQISFALSAQAQLEPAFTAARVRHKHRRSEYRRCAQHHRRTSATRRRRDLHVAIVAVEHSLRPGKIHITVN